MITHLEGDSPTQPLINIEAIPLLNAPPTMSSAMEYDTIVFGLAATKYTTVASATILVWDIIVTVDQEVSMVWSAKLSLGTTLFFCNRYLPICMFVLELTSQLSYAPSEKFCSQRMLYSTILGISSAAVVQCVLVTRTHALYQQRWLTIFLGILGFLSISSAFILFSLVFRFETFTPASTFGLRGCILGCTNGICKSMLIGFWIPFVLFETIIFGLTGWKTYKSLNSSARFSRFPSVITILFRDGLVYYIVMMSLSVCNFLIWIADPYASYLAVGFF